ncbi:MAG: cytochrome c3 family protein [Bacteroidota bacterium]
MSSVFKMKKSGIVIIVLILLLAVSIVFNIEKKPLKTVKKPAHQAKEYTSKDANNKCLKCHTVNKYEINSPDDSTVILQKKMPARCVIDSNKYYTSNHWDFKCTDCHSEDYAKVPHDSKLKYAQINTCLDCHADDAKYVKFHFEDIDTAFRKSVHFKNDSVNFNCFSCHDAHYNKTSMRDSLQDIEITVASDNAMCLKCHDTNSIDNDYEFYSSTKTAKANLYSKHSWLPALENHFKNVRCVDCHSALDEKTLVGHNIEPKKLSVKECTDCHSPNSILLKSLYKNRPQAAQSFGFLNPQTLQEQDIIGSNRNHYLNLIFIIVFGLAGFAIFVHIIFRIIKRK